MLDLRCRCRNENNDTLKILSNCLKISVLKSLHDGRLVLRAHLGNDLSLGLRQPFRFLPSQLLLPRCLPGPLRLLLLLRLPFRHDQEEFRSSIQMCSLWAKRTTAHQLALGRRHVERRVFVLRLEPQRPLEFPHRLLELALCHRVHGVSRDERSVPHGG